MRKILNYNSQKNSQFIVFSHLVLSQYKIKIKHVNCTYVHISKCRNCIFCFLFHFDFFVLNTTRDASTLGAGQCVEECSHSDTGMKGWKDSTKNPQ